MKNHKTNRLKTAGIAMVSVLFIGLSILVLVVTFSVAAMSENKAATSNKITIQLEQMAQATGEQARVKLYETYMNNHYSESMFIDKLRDQLSGNVIFPDLEGNHSKFANGTNTRWEMRAVSPEGNGVSWVDVAATAENQKGSQTVIQRIGFTKSDIFELALLTETVNCMVCHLQVNGDVGTLKHFKPGWSPPGNSDDDNAGEDSSIHGDLYAASTVEMNSFTNLNGNPKKVNGAIVTGDIEVNSRSSKLPKDRDGDGVPDFPPIKREVARESAAGSLSVNPSNGALIKTVPLGGKLTNLNNNLHNSLDSKTMKNVVLVGTEENPLIIEDDIWVEGDVIIKGVVKGIGAIYAGRNIYVAGDIILKNPPYKAGVGVCATLDADQCAKKSIEDRRDALRLGARGSIIIGDYTEYEKNSNHVYDWKRNGRGIKSDKMPWSRTQNAEFYRSQFGFGWQDEKYYDKRNGDELEWRADKQAYVNVDGDVVEQTFVKPVMSEDWHTKEVDGDDAYDYSFRPGQILPNGDFKSWVSDDFYRSILGRENFTYNSWRQYVYWKNANWWSRYNHYEDKFKAHFRASMEENGLSISDASLQEIWDRRKQRPVWPYPENSHIPIIAADGHTQLGVVHWEPNRDNGQMRVLITANGSYEKQVTKIDAFLYANSRIAGKISMRPAAILGGMIAKDIGVLAPGRRPDEWPWYQDDVGWTDDCADSSGEYYVDDSDNCQLTLNYDHRLRNGGWGFNLVFTEAGKTISWRTADSAADRVSK